MNRNVATVARLLGAQLAGVAAAVHLWWGLPRLIVYLQAGSFADPRPYLFVPSAILLLVAATAILLGVPARRLAALSVGVMLTYAVGYAWWHLTDHGGMIPGGHTDTPVATVVGHLLDDPLAMVAMVTELLGSAALAVLFVAEGSTDAAQDETGRGVDGEMVDGGEMADPRAEE